MKKITILLFILMCAGILFLAVIYGPRSCEGGFTVYFRSGICFLLVSWILPFINKPVSLRRKTILSFLCILLAACVWTGGFILGHFKIICRLF